MEKIKVILHRKFACEGLHLTKMVTCVSICEGCNMAMEVVIGDHERDVRTHDSIVMGRPGENLGNVTLRATAMRTVKSYQILQSQVHAPHGFYVSSHRYCFKVRTGWTGSRNRTDDLDIITFL